MRAQILHYKILVKNEKGFVVVSLLPPSNFSDRSNKLVSPAIASNVLALTTGDFMGIARRCTLKS
jgi:hypothetical protein